MLFKSMWRKFCISKGGNVAIIFGMVLPVSLALSGGALDYAAIVVQKTRLQGATDSGALAAAKEYTLANTDSSSLVAVAKIAVQSNLQSSTANSLTIGVITNEERGEVTVTSTQTPRFLIGVASALNVPQISVTATARVVGSSKICVLGLDEAAAGTISVEHSARLTGNGCVVYSNSTSSGGLASKNSAVAKASMFCSAGGLSGFADRFTPAPIVDCPKFPDPLADRVAPTIGGCKENWLLIQEQTTTLSPGVYCGGMQIINHSDVTLNPGVYIIKDGPFQVGYNSTLRGQNVSFYLTGSKAVFTFSTTSTIELSATKDGPLAGLLFFEDKNRKTAGTHTINSDNARLLLGTIYLPASKLVIDANAPIADQSAYTAIVAKSLKLYSGPHLVLNTNYGATDIPVPGSIKGNGNRVTLVK